MTKIPLLGDLPVIGALFRSKKVEVDKTNLLLVLTPHIVNNDEDFARIFERKLAEQREYAKFMSDRANSFQATMDWQRRVGPFGRLDRDLSRHLQAVENGGEGQEPKRSSAPTSPRALSRRSKLSASRKSRNPGASQDAGQPTEQTASHRAPKRHRKPPSDAQAKG